MENSTQNPINPNRSNYPLILEAIASRLASFVTAIGAFRKLLVIGGSILSFLADVRDRNPRAVIYRQREDLYEFMIKYVANRSTVVCEFGVAWGYTTQYWLTNSSNRNLKWFGFDRFTGLPSSWGMYPKGEFSAQGKTPQLSDSRVSWIVGDVEKTVTDESIGFIRDFDLRICIFDLDLYHPSLHVWRVVSPLLRPGDLVYLDEARMPDENLLLKEQIIPHIRVELVGATINGVVLRVC